MESISSSMAVLAIILLGLATDAEARSVCSTGRGGVRVRRQCIPVATCPSLPSPQAKKCCTEWYNDCDDPNNPACKSQHRDCADCNPVCGVNCSATYRERRNVEAELPMTNAAGEHLIAIEFRGENRYMYFKNEKDIDALLAVIRPKPGERRLTKKQLLLSDCRNDGTSGHCKGGCSAGGFCPTLAARITTENGYVLYCGCFVD